MGMWLGGNLRKYTKKTHLFQRDWTTCSKCVDHPRINNQYDLLFVFCFIF